MTPKAIVTVTAVHQVMVPAQHVHAVELLLQALRSGDRVYPLPQHGRIHQAMRSQLMAAPSTSFELRRRLEIDAKRDPADALNDAETLRLVARVRLDEMLQEPAAVPSLGRAIA